MCKCFQSVVDVLNIQALSCAGETYLRLLEAAKAGAPDIHVHAFSPLEVREWLPQHLSAAVWVLPLCTYLR